MKKLLILAALCALLPLAAQNGLPGPEDIDPYTYDPLEKVSPDGDYALQAQAAYNEGEYEMAARYYLAHLRDHRDDPTSLYNLACCYGLLGRDELAAKYLKRSYQAGFTYLEHIRQDPDFSKVRETESFAAAMDSLQTWAQRKAKYEGKQEYLQISQLIPCRLLLPEDYDPDKEYTLLIGLHGYGDKATSFSRLWHYLEEGDLIFAVPEAPYPFMEGQIGFSWTPQIPEDDPRAEQAFELMSEYIFQLIEQLESAHKIGETWILGFSQGAFIGYPLALRNPETIDGLVACGGGLMVDLQDDVYAAAKGLKIIISHGKDDRVIPFSEALDARGFLEEKGFKDIRWDEFEGGHTVSPSAIEAFLEWIKG